ncbi:hypothetical protein METBISCDRAFT_31352 [Metschnikowia bicuspidata]|uniref:Uncharacterized protein n=1 Tax=Metschnikowia bicuspidata TaxID=27322 RepID=A0A4V1J2V4_9ASCO|nr:hypothetical protein METBISCDRAFT_31352 [Metschnikowia bicuspidata]
MAQLMKEVVDKSGVVSQADILQVPEMQSGNVLEMIHAPPKEYDGYLLGIPTRFGTMPAHTLGGGQETTVRKFMSIIFAQITTFDEVNGSSPYGAGCLAGPDGSRQPSTLEREIATIQGETFVKTSIKFYKASDKPASAKEAVENSVMDESVDEKAAVEKIELQTGPAHKIARTPIGQPTAGGKLV